MVAAVEFTEPFAREKRNSGRGDCVSEFQIRENGKIARNKGVTPDFSVYRICNYSGGFLLRYKFSDINFL